MAAEPQGQARAGPRQRPAPNPHRRPHLPHTHHTTPPVHRPTPREPASREPRPPPRIERSAAYLREGGESAHPRSCAGCRTAGEVGTPRGCAMARRDNSQSYGQTEARAGAHAPQPNAILILARPAPAPARRRPIIVPPLAAPPGARTPRLARFGRACARPRQARTWPSSGARSACGGGVVSRFIAALRRREAVGIAAALCPTRPRSGCLQERSGGTAKFWRVCVFEGDGKFSSKRSSCLPPFFYSIIFAGQNFERSKRT